MKFFRGKQEKRQSSAEDAWYPLFDLINQKVGSYSGIWALKNSDIFTAVRALASDVASSPINVKKNNVIQHADQIAYLFNRSPNQYYSGFHLKFIVVANMLVNRESFVQVVRDKKGVPLQLFHLKNSQTTIVQNGAELTYQTYNEYTQEYLNVPYKDVLHFKMMSLDGINGISPLWSLVTELAMQDGGKNFVKNFFEKGAALGGLLKLNGAQLDDKQRREYAKTFSDQYAGAVNSGKVAVMDSTMDFKQLEINTDILNFLNANTFTTKQVAKTFGLPLSRMGIETTNTSTEDENLWYLQNTLTPYFSALKSEMEFKLAPPGTDIEFNTDNIRDIDPDKKIERVVKQVQNSIISPNEARKEYGKPAADNPAADELLASLNYTTLSTLSELQLAKAKPKGGGDNGEGKEGTAANTD